ncbi:hypothetical protein HY604_02180 [Candidatus Peregrinibacteria bacterium]|nr:hypothetical protein [Candidatus Peregrinibacteria bacterium]
MAFFQVDEEQKLKKALNSGIKKGNLKIIGAVLGVLVLVIVFTMVDFGNLFKGQLELASCGQPTDATYFTCVAEKAKAGNCDDISDAAGGTMVSIELFKSTVAAEQISKLNQLTDTLVIEYQNKSCDTGFLANYSREELLNYKNYCYPGSFFAYKQRNAVGNIMNACVPLPDGPFMEMLTKKYTKADEKKQWEDFYTATFEAIYKQSNINLNDRTFLTELKTDANYKTLAYTKTIIENIIIEKFTCKEGPAYVPDPANAGKCTLSCDNARSEISKAATSYYIALQQGKPATEKAQYLKTVADLVKQAQAKGCYATKLEEVQKLCSSFDLYQYELGLSAEENTLLPSITTDLKCCSGPGQSLETGVCAYKDLKFQEDLVSSLALYKYALEKNATDTEKTKSATHLKATLDAYKAQFEALGLSKFTNAYMEGKAVAGTCADELAILNSNKMSTDATGKALTDSLTDSSKLLQCCPQPGYYKLVSDPTNGEKPVYSCAVPTEEFKDFQLGQKQCYESDELSGEIGKIFEISTMQIVLAAKEQISPPQTLSCSDPAYKYLPACNSGGTLSCKENPQKDNEISSTNFYCENRVFEESEKPQKSTCALDPYNVACEFAMEFYIDNEGVEPTEQYYKDVKTACTELDENGLTKEWCQVVCSDYPNYYGCVYKKEPQTTLDCKNPAIKTFFEKECEAAKPSVVDCSENKDIPECTQAAEGSAETTLEYKVIKPLYDDLKAKNDAAISTFLQSVKALDETTKNSCKLTELSANKPICGALRDTLTAAAYKPSDYIDSIKNNLNTLANETLRCCYYENEGNTDLEINFATSDAQTGFTCSSKSVKAPTIKSQYTDKTTFNPTALEKLKITYTVDQGATVTISINDITGTEVYKFDDVNVAAQAVTSHFWDGKANAGTNAGKIVNNGTYSYSLKAKNSAPGSSAVGGNFTVTGTTVQPPQVIPQPDVKCTDNQLADNSTKICISGEWVLCTEGGIYDGQKSVDKKLTCAGGKWIDLSNPPPPPPPKNESKDPPCVENNTMMEGKRLCKGGEWITCVPNLEGKKSSDGQKECKNGIWGKAGVTPPGTTPPGATPPGGDQSSGNIKITKHSVFPVGFNPLINESKIAYTISAKAEVEIRILTQSGVTITTLVDNKVLDQGEYFVYWDGTNNASGNGKVVDPATYQYKITAKDPNNGTVKDVKTGNVNVVYVKSADFENGSSSSVTVPPVNNQAQATVAMQNATGGKTAGTGPGILIYALFPLAGYFISRYKKK